MISAVRQNGLVVNVLRVFSISAFSLPSFWLRLLVPMVFVRAFGTVPICTGSGMVARQQLAVLSVPATIVGLRASALIMRFTRSSMLGGDLTNAIIVELMLGVAIQKRLGGIVINGSVRDIAAIRASSFPVYAAGVTHRGPCKDGPGEINVPISLDGMVIEPGDLVSGWPGPATRPHRSPSDR